ncbi:NrdH-redoxin [Candidatus Pacearchaeota archaeon CG10_big_fil_rev_8_21_14_0_10_34_76]|nr:MAG: NrdH-redoxin [Candidatus Pacearchaeota archaeon CG10_big_fil_rev_8_21_14_0_10_34_76]
MSITIYSTPDCPWCKKTKEFFKEHKIEFNDVDVSSDAKAADEMIKKSGQKGVPVIDANGKIIVGFDEHSLKKALHLK